MKKKLFAIAVVVICLALCISGTLAYYTASATARNVITAGNVGIALNEKDATGKDFVNNLNILPGSAADKIVTVENDGDSPCWVRVSVSKSVRLLSDAAGEPDLSLITIDFSDGKWTEKDGWYYYADILEPGCSTEPLFTKVSFDKAMDNRYQGGTAVITVCAQAVQTVHNGEDVLSAAGWPEGGAAS